MPRRTATAAASVAALIAAFLPSPAQASGTISVTASSPASDVGQLTLKFKASTDINDFTAHIITTHGTDVLNLPQSGFTLTSGTAQAGTWTVNTPISEEQLAFGTYQVTVDATDSGGDSVTGATAGSLGYLIEPTVTLVANPTTISYSQPFSNFSGTVTGRWPDGSTAPVADARICCGDNNSYLVTNSIGQFSFPVNSSGKQYVFVTGTDLAFAASPSVTITADTAPVRLTETLSSSLTSYGKTVTVSGTASYQSGSIWRPLGGVTVEVSTPGYPQSAPATNSSGHYRTTFSATLSGVVTVYFNQDVFGASPTYPLLKPTQTARKLTVTLPTAITQFSASVDPGGTVSVAGCLGVEGPAYSPGPTIVPIAIQYSSRASGPWKQLGMIGQENTDSAGCGVSHFEIYFAKSFRIRAARAYYRAYYAGTKWFYVDDASMKSQPSTSPAELAWKYLTRIGSFKVTPRHIAADGTVTITGRLQQDTARWKPYGHQQILITYRASGSSTWYWTAKVSTRADGSFRATVKPTFNATWSAAFAGNATRYATSPPGYLVKVT